MLWKQCRDESVMGRILVMPAALTVDRRARCAENSPAALSSVAMLPTPCAVAASGGVSRPCAYAASAPVASAMSPSSLAAVSSAYPRNDGAAAAMLADHGKKECWGSSGDVGGRPLLVHRACLDPASRPRRQRHFRWTHCQRVATDPCR